LSLGTWLLPRSDLTPEQLRVVEMPPDEHRVVLGPAGSGKTQVLIHRAAHLAETYYGNVARFRVFVFTNVIREYISSGIEFLGFPEGAVSTFDNWCALLYQDYVSYSLPRKRRHKLIDFESIRYKILDVFRLRKELQKRLDFVLVDEGQDLAPEVYDILSLASRHITVFVDPQQKIFEHGADVSYILEKLQLNSQNATLLGTYRNAPYVAYLASHFIMDKELRKEFLAQAHTEQKVREKPLCYLAPSIDEEVDRLAEIVRQRQIMNERVGIIVSTNKILHDLARALEERGVEVEKAIKSDFFKTMEVVCNFDNSVPKIATYYQAKGLTFDSVLLPCIADRSFPWLQGVARKRILFVGIVRAMQWVYLSTIRGLSFEEMDILKEAESEGHLIMQYREGFKFRKKRGEREEGEEERGEEDEEEDEEEPGDDFSVL